MITQGQIHSKDDSVLVEIISLQKYIILPTYVYMV